MKNQIRITSSQILYLCKSQKNLSSTKNVFLSQPFLCPCKYIVAKCYTTKSATVVDECSNSSTEKLREQKATFREKVIYHSFYKYEDFSLQKKKEAAASLIKDKRLNKTIITSASLKYFLDDEELNNEIINQKQVEDTDVEHEEKQPIVMPYEVSTVNVTETDEDSYSTNKENQESVVKESNTATNVNDSATTVKKTKWMSDYDCYEDYSDENNEIGSDLNYGTPDRTMPMSKVPCGGCGALLHCQDPGIPGYLPSEIFSPCSVEDLRAITCQRCHFMNNYNTALSVSVDPQQYPKLLSRIKHEIALVILLVDITDFPCSIWPGIIDIIGPKRPLFVVGNKIDLLVGDRKGWIRRARESLQAALPRNANIKYSSLISAKTGFGVEELINKLHKLWGYKGDVYLVGCTNVGKSTLFNALLKSDYCNVKASDLLQRATTAPWPGTTMNLLKFPVLRPTNMSLMLRTKRLQLDRLAVENERELLKLQTSKNPTEPVQLVGHIGRTFSKADELNEASDTFKTSKNVKATEMPSSGLNPFLQTYKGSKWFYDTPGVIQPDQIINLLTTDELMKTLPKSPIIDRVFIFKTNWTLFIAGLGRIDFLKLSSSSESKKDYIKILVYCPEALPVTICETEKADSLYDEYVGSDMFVVPSGGSERLKMWPALKSLDIVLRGKSFEECCADIVLSNAGWVSIVASDDQLCKFRCWTPEARGIHVRHEPLLRLAATVHGPRMRKTPAYFRRYLKEAATDVLRN